jgi:hypothetical protein
MCALVHRGGDIERGRESREVGGKRVRRRGCLC